MERRTVTGLLLALLLVFTAVLMCRGKNDREYSVTFPVMGTVCQCTFILDNGTPQAAFSAVNEAFAKVMKLANLRDVNSELCRLNSSAAVSAFVCSEEMYYLLSESRRAYRVSNGRFDISVKPLMDLWGFYRKQGKIPSSPELSAAKTLCGLDKVEFNDRERSIRFTVPGMALDLGGIAKGYALDLAVKNLRDRNISIRRGTINLGGNIYLLGKNETYIIGIKDPSEPSKIRKTVELTSPGAVSSSGDYERYVILEGRKFGHIIDPASGKPAVRNHAATVFAPSGIESDWASTMLYLDAEKAVLPDHCRYWVVEK